MLMDWFSAQLAAVGGADFPAAVLGVVSLATGGLALWAVVLTLTPRTLRGALYVSVTGALAMPTAHADDRGVDGLRLPDRPTVAAQVEPDATVVVRPGDTLWAIAADHLGGRADDAATAREVRRWHSANVSVIGADPDLIHPGQRLTPPKDRP
jgi:nucleoid-associated protein YgaU